jgi:S-adenosylmethionine:tRNA ribosyltransferase-isomerase
VKAASWPRHVALDERLLHIDPQAGTLQDGRVRDLPQWLRAGDLCVVNDAATLPASLSGVGPSGAPLEVRLVGARAEGRFGAVLFGAGDWRTPTEKRPPPEVVAPGETIAFGGGALRATVERLSPISPRLVDLRFDREGAALWSALYRHGRPVQYAYLRAPLALWAVQTAYAARPWAVEAPSAGRPLRWSLLLELARRGVRLAAVTHAAGLSSTGDAALDAALPLPERYDLPAATVDAVAAARAAGGRVLAVGTTVVRALEGCAAAHGGGLVPGAGETDLVIGPGFRPRVVTGVLTGMHEPGQSHHALLHAFAAPDLLARAHAHAEAAGYLCHEFGDSALVL